MSTRLNFRTCNKTIFDPLLKYKKRRIKSTRSVVSHSIHSFHDQKFISSYQKDSKEKACDFLLSIRHVVKIFLKKHTCGLNESQDPYVRSIIHTHTHTHTHTHIPTYVSKDNHFYPTYFGQPWNHLFDRLY